MNLTLALTKIAPSCNAAAWAAVLDLHLPPIGITTPKRAAAFLGQAAVESMGFEDLCEDLNYSTAARIMAVFGAEHFPDGAQAFVEQPRALANRVYANRNGNGNEASGDGWNFRGRGLFQLTGRGNYTVFTKSVGSIPGPDWVSTIPGAAASACWFWKQRAGMNQLADLWQISLITRRVNGPAMLGNAQRISLSNAALSALLQE
jgi:putative chitinase